MATDSDLQCRAKEAMFAYHTAQHELSFKSVDCTSKLTNNLYNPTFLAARTKTEVIIVKAISPYIFNILLKDLEESLFYHCHYR